MSLFACACTCGSVDKKIRGLLQRCGYPDWLDIKIYQGKSKSLNGLNTLPQSDGVEMLRNFLKDSSKWAVILGYDRNGNCYWSDIAHNAPKSTVEAECIVREFANK